MKPYHVKLKLIIGEYEKNTDILVRADNREHAIAYALYSESHDFESLKWDEYLNSVYDCYGEMAYRVQNCSELTEGHFNVMAKFISCYNYRESDLLEAGNYKEVRGKLYLAAKRSQ